MTGAGWEEVVNLVTLRDQALQLTPSKERSDLARQAVISSFWLIRQILGLEVLQAAYGETEITDRADALELVARRSLLIAHLFVGLPDDIASFPAIMDEAFSISQGDDPKLFAKIDDRRKVAHRLTRSKLSALRWEAYLQGLGIDQQLTRDSICAAFSHEWDTIARWRKAAGRVLGKEHVDYLILEARVRGMQKLSFQGATSSAHDWQDLLKIEGETFRASQRQNQGK